MIVYCYCVPSAFKRRFKIRRRDSKTKENDAKQRNNPERNLTNGGSIIIKASSRKSIFTTNTIEEDRKDDRFGNPTVFDTHENDRKSNIELRNDPEGGSQETLRVAIDTNFQYQQREICPDGQAVNDLINSGKKSFSMSIPDVTKVESSRLDFYNKKNVTTLQPHFFTLGRRNTYLSSQSSSVFETCQLEFQEGQQLQSFYNTEDHLKTFKKSGGCLTHFATVGPQKGSFRPSTPGHHYKQSLDESDTSIYESQKGDSVTDIFLCDDRTSSPPPPAPSGPEANTNGSFRIKRHSVCFP